MKDEFTNCFRCERPIKRSEVVPVAFQDFCSRCAPYCAAFINNDPWPDKRVSWMLPSIEAIEELANELRSTISDSDDERPLQEYFERNPSMLVQLFRYGHGRYVFPRPQLGSEYIPDFMVCGLNSGGPYWHLIELENPRSPVLRKDGQQTAEFTHALTQINDWRIWLRDNIKYAQDQLRYVGLDCEFAAMIVMGRRSQIREQHVQRYRQLSGPRLEVMSYDRVLDNIIGPAIGIRKCFDRWTNTSGEQETARS